MKTNKFDEFVYRLKQSNKISIYFIFLFFIITYASLIPYKYFQANYSYKIGDIAKSDIKSPKDIIVRDNEATKEKIEYLKNNFPPVFDFYTDKLDLKKEKISLFFDKCRENLPEIKEKRQELLNDLKELCKCKIKNGYFSLLEKKKFSDDIEWILIRLVSYYMSKGIVPDNSTISLYKNRGVTIRLLPANEEITKRDIYTFYKLSEAIHLIEKNYIAITGTITKPYKLKKFLIYLATNIIEPNIFYNRAETEKRLKDIEKNVKPVAYILKKNETIVREGGKIDKEALIKIKAIKDEKNFGNVFKKCFSIFIILILLCLIFYQISVSDLEKFLINGRDLFFFCCLIAFSAIFYRVSFSLATYLPENFNNLSQYFFLFMIPYAFPSVLLKILINEKYGFSASIITSVFFYILSGPIMGIYVLFGSLYLIGRIKCCNERFAFIKLGFELGIFNVILISGLNFFVIKSDMFSTVAFLNCFSGIINGFFTSFLLLGFISIAEVLFRYTSDLRLIELSNLEVPLLQEFLEKAPGSYQHSILVGRLAESASKEIGANSILARVGAYYHDIGKIGKPLYFVENQSSKVNKHAKLTPNMSALILISHVKEGVELAKKYKLGDELIDIIQQHHGTSLIKFFYKKALEVNEGKVKEAIDEKNFRYPGPKPRTKEAGIIMLADVVEAASRTLHEPTPSRIRGLVKNLIESVLNDGQLDECRLTLKELTIIRESFTNTLNSIFHQRIEYPKDDNSDSANKSK
jgi:putative nucleotidyltransferase with HDIG domain